MSENHDLYSALPDIELAEHFRNADSSLKHESAVLDRVIRHVLATEGRVSNKSIILCLIMALESADTDAEGDILRRTLEIVVGYTPDDA
ncbi:biofilm development regulator YmgB/AriR family protein [Pantoea sp. NPDC088449]|uniref:Biofilm development protein YmgB/AriR n=1 Tax=Candidatus Pantoea floridensis TaxID=1938870 RepID=A0A286BM51_9GAMM|nr:biofilm development regulator YmgB/AriR family protein [Pantoea floridensis]PIF22434.1 biofilm development protein YmgB/AriR [Enterobacteriaceae bacterium JKS000233]SOD35237.1 Biofilm development protein YmgB/AriR [Pantoea floridensis]HBZ16974.1 two-component-system connector protein AriR [Pantoea sp.]